jgi:hypothetical protein
MSFSRTAPVTGALACTIACSEAVVVEPFEPHARFTVVAAGKATTHHASARAVSCRASQDLAGAPALYAHFTSFQEAPDASLYLAASPYADAGMYDGASYGSEELGMCHSGVFACIPEHD